MIPITALATVPCMQVPALPDTRPSLSGPELTVDSADGRFRVHYTEEGGDAPSGGDSDGDGLPDAVQQVLDGLALGVEVFEEKGYRELVPDTGAGGSEAIDIYVRDINANGYAYALLGQGPEGGASCFMEVDGGLASTPGPLVESVVVHELHHCVQYRYTTVTQTWMYESTATYEQYIHVTDAALDLALGVLYAVRLGTPDLPIDETGDRYEYAGFLVMKFWEEFAGGDPDRVPALWERLAEEPDWEAAMEAEALEQFDLDLGDSFLEHATWNGFACARDDGGHYDAEVLGCAGLDITVPIEPFTDGFTAQLELGPYTASYHEASADDDDRPVALTCTASEDTDARVKLVVLDADGNALEQPGAAVGTEPVTLPTVGPTDPDGAILVVVANVGHDPAEVDCTLDRTDLPQAPEGGCGCDNTGSLPMALALSPVVALLRRRSRTP